MDDLKKINNLLQLVASDLKQRDLDDLHAEMLEQLDLQHYHNLMQNYYNQRYEEESW
jgi:hypothetical protein